MIIMETYYKSVHVAMSGSVDLTGFIVVVWHYFWCLEIVCAAARTSLLEKSDSYLCHLCRY